MIVPVACCRLPRACPGHDLDVRRRDARTQHFRDAQLVADAEAAKRLAQPVHGQARVDQSAEQHVAGGPGEAVEVHHPRHQSSPASFIDEYCVSARMMWSISSTPTMSPACRSRRVSSTSSLLAAGSPDGWL